MTHPHSLLSSALAAADRGWSVVPLWPGSKRPAGHPEANCPLTGRCADGHLTPEQRATTDRELIRRAWTQAPFGIGIATGPSGLVVVDLDVAKGKKEAPDGATTFQALCERNGQPWPATYTVRTPSGGQHLYFTAPAGADLRNTQGRLGTWVDTRAWGGYVVAAGTDLPTGLYTADNEAEPVPLPAWLHKALSPAPPRPGPVVATATAGVRANRYAAAALRNETGAVANAPQGARNSTLVRAARALGRLVASGDLDREEVEEALKGAGIASGQSVGEVAAVVTNALNWSISHNPQTVA